MNIKFIHIQIPLFLLSVLASFPNSGFAQTGDWKTVTTSGIIHRHECSFTELNGKFYLVGGREQGRPKYTNVYDPATKTWSTGTTKPTVHVHHVQAVTYNGLIYMIGGFTGGHPNETPIDKVHIYNPGDDSWTTGATIPENRRRGAAGAVVYNNKIYIIGGATNGHIGGNVAWLDEFDPATGTWTALQDAPHARDHFQAALNGNKLYVAAGRMSKMNWNTTTNKYDNVDVYIGQVDVYDLDLKTWTTLPNTIPTMRAGTSSVILNNELLVIGGESPSQLPAHNQTEALDLSAYSWRTMATLDSGRHGTNALVYNNKIYIVSGSKGRGGSDGSELNSMEEFTPEDNQPNSLSMPSELNFGQVVKNETKTLTLTITNSSTSTSITINTISLVVSGGEFSISSKPALPHTLAAGASATVELIFDPATTGNKTATLNMTHTGENNPSSVSLKGEGVLNVTGVDKGNLFSAAVIYPNPTKNQITINNVSSDNTWEIVTATGIKMISGKTDFNNSQTIDISYFTEGIYILTLKNKEEDLRKSFLIKKE